MVDRLGVSPLAKLCRSGRSSLERNDRHTLGLPSLPARPIS
jgi:hypothetical protein